MIPQSHSVNDEGRAQLRDAGTTTYEIGPFRLDPAAAVLTRVGVAEALGPRAIAVLAALVQHPREPVTKRALMQAAWPGLVVEDANLSVQISSIRRVLAQVPGGERWLETLSRRGYRFIGPVVELRDGLPRLAQRDRIGYLPESLTSFVGRERELVDLKRLLAKNRLLTLVGAGGVGKTRLALQASAEVKDAYRDGIWFLDFASLDDPLLVPNVAAQVLGVRQLAGNPLVDALRRRVEGQRLLLIFDNCEHVLDAAARLAESLLRSASEPAILATSREPLRIGGEQVYRLPTLSVPGLDASPESMGHSDSVLLFVDRAQHQQHDFALTHALAPAVARLCVRLDGIPFALELAAALVPTYSIDEINTRLADRFTVLTEGNRTALPRQQTLRATLDWSYALLSPDERKALRRVSIFHGGFTLGAAVDVVTDSTVQSSRAGALVEQLAARSLLNADARDVETRYRMLDTTRAYGLEKLEEARETAALERRHAEYFSRVFRDAGDAWLRLADAEWRSRYLPDVDNARAALDWSLDNGDSAIAIALAGGSGPLWASLSLYGEGIERLSAAAARLSSGEWPSDEARLWLWSGLLLEASAPAQAVAAFERAVDLYRTLDDADGFAQATISIAHPLVTIGRSEDCANTLAQALPALERSGSPRLRAAYFANAGFLKAQTNDWVGAQALYNDALARYREIGSAGGTAASLNNVANASWALGDLDAAERAFREAAVLHRNSGHRGNDPVGFTLGNLAGVLTERGKLAEALEVAREGLPLLSGAGNAWMLIDHLALRAALHGNFVNAAKITGFADSAHAAKGATRQPNEARARKRVEDLSRAHFDAKTLEQHLAAGARMREADACRLALEA